MSTTVAGGWPPSPANDPGIRKVLPFSYIVYKDPFDSKFHADTNGTLGSSGTDYVSTDAATVMRSAATALSTTGGTIFVKQGTYTISTDVNIGGNNVCIPLYSNTRLVGEGESTILKFDSKANFADIVTAMIGNINFTNGLGPDTNIQVSNLQIDGNKANRVITPLNTNADTLVYFDGSSGVECANILIDHVYAHDSNGNCFQYRFVGYSWIRDCYLLNNGQTSVGTPSGVYFPNTVHDTEVSNVVVKGGAWRAYKMDTWNNLRFIGCEALSCADDGWSVSNGSDGDWIACKADSNTGNGWATRGTPHSYVRIIGGIYNNNGSVAGDNISIGGTQMAVIGVAATNAPTGAGIHAGSASMADIVIQGNICKGNFTDGINIDGTTDSDILVIGNRCTGNTGRGIRIINNPTSNLIVSNNDLAGNTIAAIGFPASATNVFVRDNTGYNPQGIVAITVTASPFTYTNNDSVREAIYIIPGSGGTISQIAKNSINLLNANLSGMATVWLEPTEAVTVTYATATAVMNKDQK